MFYIIKDNFISLIRSIFPKAKDASGKREVVIRCPFCGDSHNQDHAHLYISVPQTQDELSFYHCKKCDAHGIVDDDLLRKIGCYDANVLVDFQRHNAELLKLPKYKTLKTYSIYPLKNIYISNSNASSYKLKYISNRIGYQFRYEDMLSLKIVLNIFDLIKINKLDYNRDYDIMTSLNTFFMGFISYDNSFCTMRCITNHKDNRINFKVRKRYINYKLVNKDDQSRDFYVIPTKIDITHHIKIHISEGAFDILSIYVNLNRFNNIDNIYIASGGKSYRHALEFILCELGIIDYEVHVYVDKDVSDREFYRIFAKSCIALPVDIYIHKNMKDGEKDYGVSIDHIIDSIIPLKDIVYGY